MSVLARRTPSPVGAAIGGAVHQVLELVSLTAPSDDEVSRLIEAACEEHGIPAHVEDVAARVRHALSTLI